MQANRKDHSSGKISDFDKNWKVLTNFIEISSIKVHGNSSSASKAEIGHKEKKIDTFSMRQK
jgi:hypothetical protein